MHFDRPTPLEGEEGLKNWIIMFCSELFEGMKEEGKHAIIENEEKALKPSLVIMVFGLLIINVYDSRSKPYGNN
ncbi:hypothetical protein [Ureibacillus thermosphaericus]|uniref:hypothetical protein n=1 Tax=Ureibacillus thermosphaericus TaxID=51173 RepID=UPI002F94333B